MTGVAARGRGAGRRIDAQALQTVRRPSAAELRRRLPRLLGGLGVIALGTALMVRSGLGLSPYEVLHQGVSFRTPLSIGQASILVGGLSMLAWIPLRQRPGIGTVVNVIGVGLMVDAWLLLLEAPAGLPVRLAWNVTGVVAIGLGIGLYIGAGLGPGPRDGLLTGLALRGVPLWMTRGVLEVSSLALGWWLGGTVGVGTLLFAGAVPFLVQYSARWTVGAVRDVAGTSAQGVVVRPFADRPEVAEPSNGLVLRSLVTAEDAAGDLSVTWVRLEGHHRRLRTDASARLYVVITGGGSVTVGDGPPRDLADGDVVLLPPGTPYHLDGPLTYLVMNRPAYRAGDDVYLED